MVVVAGVACPWGKKDDKKIMVTFVFGNSSSTVAAGGIRLVDGTCLVLGE
jgi:hypothetical protein